MTMNSTHLYWTIMSGGVSRVPLAGGTLESIDTNMGYFVGGRFAIVVDGTDVWYDGEALVGFTPIAGGSASGYPLGGPIVFASIAQDSTSVYGAGLVSGSNPDGVIMKVNKSTGALQTLASGQNIPVSVAYDNGNVYWAEQDLGNIKSVRLSDGSITTLASGQEPTIHSIAVDGTNVYWGSGAGYIKKVPVGGGSVSVVASGKVCPLDVVVNDSYVYWTNQTSGEIVRAKK
jgi:hypothetical protein